MVKQIKKIQLPVFILGIFLLVNGCNVDLLGLFASNDLDVRLKERNNLKFLDDRDWITTLTLGDSFSFIVVTDTHIEGDASDYEGLIDVVAGNSDIKFLVNLGDITQYGAEDDIDSFIETTDLMGIPCYPVAGNHDVYFDYWDVWQKKIGSTNYRIDAGGATLLILDSANSFLGKDQLDWLERELRTAEGRVFVFTHSPLFVKGPADMQQITNIKERARMVSMLRDKCDIMFTGHSHKEFYNKTGNVEYVTLEDFKSQKSYCLVNVTPTGITRDIGKL